MQKWQLTTNATQLKHHHNRSERQWMLTMKAAELLPAVQGVVICENLVKTAATWNSMQTNTFSSLDCIVTLHVSLSWSVVAYCWGNNSKYSTYISQKRKLIIDCSRCLSLLQRSALKISHLEENLNYIKIFSYRGHPTDTGIDLQSEFPLTWFLWYINLK